MKEHTLKDGTVFAVRNARVADAEALLEYINKVALESDFLTFGEGEFGITLGEEKEHLKGIQEKKNALYLIAEIDKTIVGGLVFHGGKRPRIEHSGEFSVTVLKAYWGQGIGKQLVKSLIAWACGSKVIRKIDLRVRSDHYKAVSLYENLGFKKEGTIKRQFLIDGQFYDSFAMGLNID